MTGDNGPVRNRCACVVPLLLIAIIFSMAYTARTQTNSSPAKKSVAPKSATRARALSSANKQWVEATLRKMTDDEKIGQLLFTTYHGSFTSTDADAYRKMMHDVDDLHVVAFIKVAKIFPLGILKSQAYPP